MLAVMMSEYIKEYMVNLVNWGQHRELFVRNLLSSLLSLEIRMLPLGIERAPLI